MVLYNRRSFLAGLAAATFAAGASPVMAAGYSGLQYAVLDYETGEELVTHKAHTKRHPASLTKVMALYVIMQTMIETDFDLDSSVLFPKDLRIKGGLARFRRMKRGHKYKARDLLVGAGSRSDAYSIACLAVHAARTRGWGSGLVGQQDKFVDQMNKAARALGMKDTHFSVITGRPHPANLSTPSDMAKLMIAMQRDFPWLSEVALGQTSFHINALSPQTRHTCSLVWRRPDIVKFAKTGFTNAAGYCLATHSIVNGRKLVSVVLGASPGKREGITMDILKRAALVPAKDIVGKTEAPTPMPRRPDRIPAPQPMPYPVWRLKP